MSNLDIEQPGALVAYLRQAGRIGPNEQPAVRALAGGVSSRTVLVERANGEAWVLKQSLPKLRVPVDWFSDPQRIHCEATALRWLAELAPPGSTPRFVFEDHEQHVLAMDAVPQPHANWKALLLAGGLQLRHAVAFGRLLGAIHRNASARLDELAPDFAGCTFFESLRVEPYYRYTATQAPQAAPFLHALIEDTLALRLTLVHGDYSPKNVLIHDDALVLLDHEVAHIGDPAFDLGFSLTHLLSKARHLPAQRADFAQAANAYYAAYGQALGNVAWRDGLEPRAARHTLACLLARVAGRSQLEYLNAEEKARQRGVVLALMPDAPRTVAELVARFIAKIHV